MNADGPDPLPSGRQRGSEDLSIRPALAIPSSEFRRAGHALIEAIADHLDTLSSRPVTLAEPPHRIRALIGGDDPLPERGTDPTDLLLESARILFEHSLFNGHPRYFGYITSSPAHIGILAEALAAAVNSNVGSYTLAPVATEIEAQTIRWVAELIGYPTDCGGLLVSGGNMANLVGFITARTARTTGDVPAAGLVGSGCPALRVYCSRETHTWIQKAADVTGLGTESIRWIPTDASLRMDASQLRSAMLADQQAGDLPLLVVGTAGSVSTGAIDPLYEIADVCREFGAWFHVDGAYGGFAAALRAEYPDLGALGLADSVAVDPHKWLYAPLEAGCALVRNRDLLHDAFSYHPPYYHFGEEATNYVDYGLQNSRGFRTLKVWLGLRHAGRDGYARRIEEDIALATRLAQRLRENGEFEVITCSLSIVTFRYVPEDARERLHDEQTRAYLDRLNESLLDDVQRSGEAFVSNAVIAGRYALRACIVNFNTRAADVDALPGIVAQRGRVIHTALRREEAG
jgi:aromatic-L-amino-acid/L-tryptophan decarboxylase